MPGIPDRLTTNLADRYRIERELGAGGMATVYLAADLKHDRRVAIKVVHPELAAVLGADRFLSEIKTTAALQHPHILPLFDSGEADGQLFYVMPLIEGESLRERLKRDKQLPIDEAVRLAREVADALSYAHSRGVIHRDIKPENILMHGGHALVADFGIALAVQSAGGTRLTQTGLSLGTPQYMAPEQAMGEKTVDGRADVYALGAVTYEMLTGEPPFTGPTGQAIVAKLLTTEPVRPVELRKTIPAGVEDAVLTALQKLPADRFATAAELAAALGGAGTATRPAQRGPATTTTTRRSAPLTLVLAAALAVAVAVAIWGWRRADRPPPHLVRVTLDLGAARLTGGSFALSPDGSKLAIVARDTAVPRRVFIRSLEDERLTAVRGVEAPMNAPVFAPDGRSLAYLHCCSPIRLTRVSVTGGGVIPLAEITGWGGASWGEDGLVFADRGVLSRISATGGAASVIQVSDSAGGFANPHLLPDGKTLIASRTSGRSRELIAVSLDGRRVVPLGIRAPSAFYVDGGFLVYGEGTSIRAIRFDAKRMRPAGESMLVAENLTEGENAPYFSAARDGTVAYATGSRPTSEVEIIDRAGRVETLAIPPAAIVQPRFSPDGGVIAYGSSQSGRFNQDVWAYDLVTRRTTRLTTDTASSRPEWTTDGRALLFVHLPGRTLYRIPADGSAGPTPFFERANGGVVEARLLNDSRIVFREDVTGNGIRDILVAPVDSPAAARPLAATLSNERGMTVTADGTWLAFVSDRSGVDEVYVRRLEEGSAVRKVSSGQGVEPRWGPGGRELFYRSGDSLYVVPMTLGDAAVPGEAKAVFADPYNRLDHEANYDVSPDGKRFVFVRSVPGAGDLKIHLLLNWFDQLDRRRAGAAR